MKKILSLTVILLLLFSCLAGCREEAEAGCTKYTLVSMGMGNMIMSGTEAQKESGISDLYLKLYDDGSAKMRVSEEIIQMQYANGEIWRTETPDAKATYAITGDTVTITDGAFSYVFKK